MLKLRAFRFIGRWALVLLGVDGLKAKVMTSLTWANDVIDSSRYSGATIDIYVRET